MEIFMLLKLLIQKWVPENTILRKLVISEAARRRSNIS
jgi:hypothetical protein